MVKITKIGLCNIITNGIISGTVGVIIMTIGEKIEQTITNRPNSYIPAHTLEKILRLQYKPDSQRLILNHTMHFGQGIIVGIIRSIMSSYGIQGPFSSFILIFIRLTIDQTLENITGVGSLPWTWPYNEQIIDILHKSIYAFVTGTISDYLIVQKYKKIN